MNKQITQSQTLNYYQENKPHLPRNPHRHQYRYITQDEEMHKIKKQIKKPRELQEILIKTTPKAVYYMHSKFLNPEKVNTKWTNDRPGYRYLQNLFLDSPYIIDFDQKHSDLENIKKTINILRGRRQDNEYIPRQHFNNTPRGFKDLELRQTGNGYHLLCFDFSEQYCNPKAFKNPANRENHHKQMKQRLTRTLVKCGCRFDEPISTDTRRIIRVPQTLHENGTIIRRIPINTFMNHTHPPSRSHIKPIKKKVREATT